MNELITDQDIFKVIDDVVLKAVTIGDPLIALELGHQIKRSATIQGLALARLLSKLQDSWHLFEAAGIEGSLADLADIHMDIRPATTKKYIDMWKKVFENPSVEEDIKALLTDRPIGDLLLLTAAVGEGSLAGEDLKHVALSPDKESIREAVRKARGVHTSANTAITLCVARVDKGNMKAGTLYAKQGNKRVILGNLILEQDSDLGDKAINALLNGRPIVEVYN